jgi:O-antigen/teichoic acid export membrane protein
LIPSLGAMGAVIAGGCAIVLVNALGALAVYRISTNRIQFGYWMKLVLATVACSYVTSLLHQSEEVVSLILSGLAYLLLLCGSFLIVKPLTSEDTEWFGRVNARATKLLAKFTTFRPTLAETNVS